MKILLRVLFCLSSLNLTTVFADNYYYPPTDVNNDTWSKKSAESLGWDLERLNGTIEYVASKNSTGFIILHKGKIIVEEYWQGWDLHSRGSIFSVTKTLSAFMAGQAQEQGLLSINNGVSDYLGNGWSNAIWWREQNITLKHLLTMTSGLNHNLNYLQQPDTVWRYNTPAYNKVYESIAAVTGLSRQDFSEQYLFTPLGMHDSIWSSPSIHSSARDMARFGLMLLKNGTWDGLDIISDKRYLSDMLNTSQALNPAYGYLTWLNGKSSYVLPDGTTGNGSMISEGPADLFAALGAADKKIHIVPSLDLVVVRHGSSAYDASAAASQFDNELWLRLCSAIPACHAETSPDTVLSDDFENFNNLGWDTDFRISNLQAHSGTKSLLCNRNSTELISPLLNLSNRSWFRLEFWYRDHGIDDNDDVFIQLHNGLNYTNQSELGISAIENSWTKYSLVVSKTDNPEYFHDNFNFKITCSEIDHYENLRVDDVEIVVK